jgi:hypothetical protein
LPSRTAVTHVSHLPSRAGKAKLINEQDCNSGDFVCDRENSAKGKGGGGKAAGPLRMSELTSTKRSVLEEMAENEVNRIQLGPKADCTKYGPGANIAVTGHKAAKGGNAHLAYNADGHYVWAASCFVADLYQKSAGKQK